MHERRTTLGRTPALMVSQAPAELAAQRGTVLVLHGFTASKDVQRTEVESLAQHGYLAVGLDAVGHGERRWPDFQQRFSGDGERPFFELVQQTANELPGVLAALRELELLCEGRLGAVGFSMGGTIVLGSVGHRCAFDAVATVVAPPHWRQVGEDFAERLEAFFPTPLLMQTGERDEVISPAAARALAERLRPHYASAPERLRFVEYAGEAHLFSPNAWRQAWGEVLGWFDTFLRPAAR
jgi:uncharacterized protein